MPRPRSAPNPMLFLPLLLIARAIAIADAPPRPSEQVEEHWYLIRMQGQHAGWMHERTVTSGDRVTSGMRMHLALRRGDATVTTEIESSFIETADGKPIEAMSSTRASDEVIEKRFEFAPDGVRVTLTQGGRRAERKLEPFGEDWLTPTAVSRHLAERIGAGDREISYRGFDPATDEEPARSTVRLLGPARIEHAGKTVDAIRSETESESTPGLKSTDYLTKDGSLLRSEIDLGGIAMVIELADRTAATVGIDSAPELLVSTLVKPSFSLRDPRKLEAARYRLSVPDGEMPDLAATSVQRVERIDATTLVVTVDLGGKPDPADAAPEVKHSPMIDGTDPAIVDLSKVATRGAGTKPTDRAEAMRRFVHRFIRDSNLNVAFASASEVARSRSGDCTEHAVLLAAMLRADAIPARTVSGLIYVDEFLDQKSVFGYHMWTQAWIDGRWVDLDATLARRPFDAAHIALTVSDLDAGLIDEEGFPKVTLLGRLRIDMAE